MDNDPLKGIRVFLIGSVWAGPMCAALLSDLGAQVIRLESHAQIDPYRTMLARDEGSLEQGSIFHCLNRNSLSITLDLSKKDARELAKKIVKKSDILLENMTPGILKKWGLDYPAVKKINPEIIMASISGFGQTGRLSAVPAYGLTSTCLSGLISMSGYENEPVGFTTAYPDPACGLLGFFAIMAALNRRHETGNGGHIDISHLEATAAMMGEELIDYTMNSRVAREKGNSSHWMAPHGCYPCLGDDRWITIACETDEEWHALCEATGHPQWVNDERFIDLFARLENKTELDHLISDWTGEQTDYHAMEILQKAGVAAVPVFTTAELFTDPHITEEEYLVHLPHPEDPVSYVYNTPWKFSETPASIRRHAPLLGEHNEFVLCDICDVDKKEFTRLVDEQVIW